MRSFVSIVLCVQFIISFQWPYAQPVAIRYTESNTGFPNPERGFYIPSQTHAGNFVPLNERQLTQYRTIQQKHGSASYAIYSTLLFRYYILDEFVDKPLTADFLQKLDNDFAVVRNA